MPWDALFAYLHLLAAGAAAALKVAEHWLLARPPDRLQVRLLGQARLGYLLAVTSVLATGLARLQGLSGTQGAAAGSGMLVLKAALFLLLLLLTVPATRTVVRWSREARSLPSFAPLSRELEAQRATISLEIGLLALAALPAIVLTRGAGP